MEDRKVMAKRMATEADYKRRLAMPEISHKEWNRLLAQRGEREIKLRELWALRRRAIDREFVRHYIKKLCEEIRVIDHNYKREL
jgi:hypothetical protein